MNMVWAKYSLFKYLDALGSLSEPFQFNELRHSGGAPKLGIREPKNLRSLGIGACGGNWSTPTINSVQGLLP